MRARCPTCGYRFEREEGFFLGAYVVNLAVTEGLLLVAGVIPTIVFLARNPDASILPIMVVGLVVAIVAPIAFYPFARTLWSAIDLILRPADTSEPTDWT